MNCLYPVNHSLALQNGLTGVKINRKTGLGAYKVYLGHKAVRLKYGRNLRAYAVCECYQYACYLTFLIGFKFTDVVIGLNNLFRFNEYCLARCGLIMHYAAYLALESGCYGQHQAAVTHSGCGILINNTVSLCLAQYGVENT